MEDASPTKWQFEQFILRQHVPGDISLATARRSYRNFFYSNQRRQMMGLRLADDA